MKQSEDTKATPTGARSSIVIGIGASAGGLELYSSFLNICRQTAD